MNTNQCPLFLDLSPLEFVTVTSRNTIQKIRFNTSLTASTKWLTRIFAGVPSVLLINFIIDHLKHWNAHSIRNRIQCLIFSGRIIRRAIKWQVVFSRQWQSTVEIRNLDFLLVNNYMSFEVFLFRISHSIASNYLCQIQTHLLSILKRSSKNIRSPRIQHLK